MEYRNTFYCSPHFPCHFDFLKIHGIKKLCIVQAKVLTAIKKLLDIILM